MPKFDYTNMPYEPKQSTGERVPTNAFYNPNPDYKESEDIYTGYYTYSYSGVTYWEHEEDGEINDRKTSARNHGKNHY